MDVLIAAVSGAVVLVIREGVAAMIRFRAANTDLDRRERKDDTAEERRQKKEQREALREYVELLQADHEKTKAELSELRQKAERDADAADRRHEECLKRESAMSIRCTRAEGRIEVLEDALRAANIRFRSYNPDQSDQHRALPPGGQP